MSGNFNEKDNINNMKRNLTLDFNKVKTLNMPVGNSGLLLSPDLTMLKVDTPELESMILGNPSVNTPTPSFFPKSVTMEQTSFVNGFEEALSKLHNSNGSDSNTSTIYNDTPFLPIVKEEPQTVPNTNSPPMSPVDMEYQERMKLERKRQRNRLAASKCRSRKLERISKLEDKVKQLKCENTDLATHLAQLKETVGLLKLEVMEHANAGCPIIVSQF
ncbi:transcription factor AP-1 [Harmonia axyridis]|uniref:transcription factor AP-1 n=1 Tax=Harmonia axyridis TaxID=115357 RepID=UPI001E275C1F|nr:transcription factor AP-1 [Harmonia axyridis]XP_045476553.1 transcription factor AP-1 [Harmonia axyridis]